MNNYCIQCKKIKITNKNNNNTKATHITQIKKIKQTKGGPVARHNEQLVAIYHILKQQLRPINAYCYIIKEKKKGEERINIPSLSNIERLSNEYFYNCYYLKYLHKIINH